MSDKHDSQHHSHDHKSEQNSSGKGHHRHGSWTADEYEKIVNGMSYNGPKIVVEHFMELGIDKKSKIIDIAAGTGLVGLALHDNGFTNIDALDGSSKMLVMAKERNCYANIFTCSITTDAKLPFEDHTYDHIIMSGSLCHIDYESLPQIIRICKPGGIICWAIALAEDLIHTGTKFCEGKFENYIEILCAENLWKYVPGFPKRVNNYAAGKDGWVFALKVL